MKLSRLSRLRPADRPLHYVPDAQERMLREERQVPRPAHLGVR